MTMTPQIVTDGVLRDATPELLAELAASIAAAPPLVFPRITYKGDIFRRLTDAEFPIYEAIRAQFPPRLAALFDSAAYISDQDDFYPDLVAACEQAFGQERAAEVLEPSSGGEA